METPLLSFAPLETCVSSSRITLELEPGADPIRGVIEQVDGSRQPFWGWLQLMEELRRANVEQRVPPAYATELSTGPPGGPNAANHPPDPTTEENL